ncbi:MAG: CapA family protein [Gaiellaceae bacterium]
MYVARILLAPAATAVVGLLLWATGTARVAQAQAALEVRTTLPPWVAPGAVYEVGGRAAPATSVRLWVGTSPHSRVVSGPLGGFRFRVRAPRSPGRYAIAVTSGGARVEAGTLRVRPLVLAAAGDVTFGDGVLSAIELHGARWPWRSVAGILRSADLALANLEGAVSTRGSPWPGKKYTFRGPPYALRVARSYAGIDAMSLANNHTLDYGRTAFADTIANARQFRIATAGGGRDLAAARRPAILTAGNLRVALLGYSDVRPLGFDAGSGVSGTAPAFPEYIRADVRAARRRADLVVVYFHWGIELARTPSDRQRSLAQTAFDAGAQVILGAHPHVLQPRGRRTGGRFVAWSLGNFVFAAHSPRTEATGILRLRLGRQGVLRWGFRRATIHWVQPRLD